MERGKKIVLDASLIVKWFSQEEGTEIALQARDRHISGEITITVPDLLIYEVANALTYNPGFDDGDVKAAVRDIFEMELDLIWPDEELLNKAAEYASEEGITVYDGCYISLAEILGLEFFTADGRLSEKTEDLDFVETLEELQE